MNRQITGIVNDYTIYGDTDAMQIELQAHFDNYFGLPHMEEMFAGRSPTVTSERCDCKHGCLNFAIPGENYCHDCGYAVWWEHDTTHGKPHGCYRTGKPHGSAGADK